MPCSFVIDLTYHSVEQFDFLGKAVLLIAGGCKLSS